MSTDDEQALPEPDWSRINRNLTWSYCGPPPARVRPRPRAPLPKSDEPIFLSADSVVVERRTEIANFEGAVKVDRGSQHVEADQATYNRNSNRLLARGDVFFEQPGLRILGADADIELAADRGELQRVQYRLVGNNARGSADLARIETPSRSHYENITYTTCPPGIADWELQAERLDIDRDTGTGTARNAKVRLRGVPILWAPYLSFPIDDRRKSGFLAPSFGNTDETGIDIEVPYYFNIAPEMDATFKPRFMGKRGLMLAGELRYLTAQHNGTFEGQLVPDDRRFEDGSTRGAFRFLHSGTLAPRWTTNVNVSYVSDQQYLEDFGNRLALSSTRNIEQIGDLRYQGNGWSLRGRLQNFQTVDAAIPKRDQPYSRLPQLLLKVDPFAWRQGLRPGLDAEYDYFDHIVNVRGNRLAFKPNVSLPLRRSFGHLTPKAALYQTNYGLIDEAPGQGNNPSLTVPSFSLDGGLVFDRAMNWAGRSSTQTLEPRLYYLYTPFKDQDDLPVFDSAELDFQFANLFRENRFTGRDRVGDANQLTVALTSRALDDATGRELFRASVGQILYFADRRVQLAGPTEDDSTSAIAGELAAVLTKHWSSRASLQWNPNVSHNQREKSTFELHYQTQDQHLVNLAYRFNRAPGELTDYEDTDFSFRWPFGPDLELVGRWYYSLLNSRTTDLFGGIEYGRCCWRVRAIARNFLNRVDASGNEDFNTVFMVQLELNGLGKFGDPVQRFLERGVYGYRVE